MKPMEDSDTGSDTSTPDAATALAEYDQEAATSRHAVLAAALQPAEVNPDVLEVFVGSLALLMKALGGTGPDSLPPPTLKPGETIASDRVCAIYAGVREKVQSIPALAKRYPLSVDAVSDTDAMAEAAQMLGALAGDDSAQDLLLGAAPGQEPQEDIEDGDERTGSGEDGGGSED